MCKEVYKMNSAAATPSSPQRGLPQRILPYILLVAFIAFREFNPTSTPISSDGPYSSVPANHTTNSHHPGCSNFKTSSMEDLWRGVQRHIFNSTYLPDNNDRVDKNVTDEDTIIHEKMIQWTHHLMEFHTIERLRRSLGNRPSSSSILRVLSIISDYHKSKVPLKILVTGGSVTAGHWCIENPVGWDGGKGGAPFKECAWPSRLERHLRQLFFNDPTVPGIVVYNMAVGATTVDVATMILEYGLLPDDLLSPDVVLLAHSTNDANALNSEQLFYTHLNNAVRAAKRLKVCDEDLPLVGIIDDNVGMDNISQAMETTARYYASSSWHDLLYINYANIARHTLLRRYEQNRTEPLLGGKFQVHGGMGFHISMAWTAVFNFMSLMMDACFDYIEGEHKPQITLERWDREANLSSLENVPWGSSPSKHIGGLHRTSDPYSVKQEWIFNMKEDEAHCASLNDSNEVQPVCTHAWMINKLAGIMQPRDITRAMKPVLKSSFGWEASGHFYSFPRLGYYASEKYANFYLEIPVTAPTVYFTVLSTVSYGPNFVDTNLRIEIDIGNDNAIYNISGYHEVQSSPLVPHKFKLPRVAKQGDVIHFNATLTSGSYFKITGLAFCKQ
ncbi:hypothetical protein ACHAXN_007315 [Cyclotella atomus]